MKGYNTLVNRCLPLLLACLAASCTGDEGDDLDQFIRNAGNEMQVKVKPLPDVKSYLPFEFNADGTLADPFKYHKVLSKAGLLQPDTNRAKEPMESFPLESLRYVGMLEKGKLVYALLRTPEGGLQQVKLGNYVGQNFGQVSQIKDNEVVIKEIVQDDATGDWVERISVISLQE